jgi:acyl dehydratase
MKGDSVKKPFEAGASVSFTRKVTEKDILAFAELSGDFSPNHVDEEMMKKSKYGKRIAHGALLVGYMSTASTLIFEKYEATDRHSTAVSLGYDRIRFIKPVFIDDLVTVNYTVDRYDQDERRSYANIEIHNQHGELVAVGVHILKWVPN